MNRSHPQVEPPALSHAVDAVSALAASRLHQLLDAPGPPPSSGDPLPPLWHWLAFLPSAAQRDLGIDGHPRALYDTGPLTRRMFAGGRVALRAPCQVGEELVRRTAPPVMKTKAGRSGQLLFVTLRHVIEAAGVPAIEEEVDLVYCRPQSSSPPDASADQPQKVSPASELRGSAPPDGQGGAAVPGPEWLLFSNLHPDSKLLFRFSALTYNAHRIHYDHKYAMAEGYPDLVVQGPLQALALAEICRRGDVTLSSFRFRSYRPALVGRTIALRGRVDGGTAELCASDDLGSVSMKATAEVIRYPGYSGDSASA